MTGSNPPSSTTVSGVSPTTTPELPKTSKLSTGAQAGLGVGISIAILTILVLACLLYRKRKASRIINEEYTGKAELSAESTPSDLVSPPTRSDLESEGTMRLEMEAKNAKMVELDSVQINELAAK